MTQNATAVAPAQPLKMDYPAVLLGLPETGEATYPSPFMQATERLACLWGITPAQALECFEAGTLYEGGLIDAARWDFWASLGPDDSPWASAYIDFERYALDCLASGRLVEFEWAGRHFVAAPFPHHGAQQDTEEQPDWDALFAQPENRLDSGYEAFRGGQL